MYSESYGSKKIINVVPRSKSDIVRGYWEDGKPDKVNPFGWTPGDGIVPSDSASQLFSNKTTLWGNHGEVIYDPNNINLILSAIGIENTTPPAYLGDNHENALVVKLNSPGTLMVCNLINICNESLSPDLYFTNEKMFILPNYLGEKLSIKILAGGDSGDYELMIGNVDKVVSWEKVYGNLQSSQVDEYEVSGSAVALKTLPTTLQRQLGDIVTLRNLNEKRKILIGDFARNMDTGGSLSAFEDLIVEWNLLDSWAVNNLPSNKEPAARYGEEYLKGLSKVRSISDNFKASLLVDLAEDLLAESTALTDSQKYLKKDKQLQSQMIFKMLGI
jgi:hypothetical protein